MASSGTIQGTVYNHTSHFSFYIEWSATQNISQNYSDVTATTYWSTNNSAYTFDTVGKRSASITIGGSTSTISKVFDCNPWPSGNVFSIQTHYARIEHNDDGTKSIVISATADGHANSGGQYYGPNKTSSQPCNASATITLDAIPRHATITSADDFSDADNPRIAYSNSLGGAVTSLEACISLTGATADVPYREIGKASEYYRFELTNAERDILRNGTTTASRTVKFMLKTVYGGNTYTDTKTVTFKVNETSTTKPTLSITPSAYNGTLPSTFAGLYIQGKSKADIAISAQGKYNATISTISTSLDSKTYSGSSVRSSELASAGTLTITSSVTDSRGFSNSATANISVIPYRQPEVVNITGASGVMCYRSDSSGNPDGESTTLWVKAKKSYYPITVDGTDKNTCALRVRSKLADAQSYGAWATLTTTNNEFNGLITGTYAITNAYTIQIGVLDDIGESGVITLDAPAFNPTVHLGSGGASIGIGRYADTASPKSVTLADDWRMFFGGVHRNELVTGSLLTFALGCGVGLTPFATNNTITDLPPAGDYYYSTGLVNRSSSSHAIIFIIDITTCEIAINSYANGAWVGWKIITPNR